MLDTCWIDWLAIMLLRVDHGDARALEGRKISPNNTGDYRGQSCLLPSSSTAWLAFACQLLESLTLGWGSQLPSDEESVGVEGNKETRLSDEREGVSILICITCQGHDMDLFSLLRTSFERMFSFAKIRPWNLMDESTESVLKAWFFGVVLEVSRGSKTWVVVEISGCNYLESHRNG